MGFNSYMSNGLGDETGLKTVALYFKSKGLQELGYTFINTDEGWEKSTRDSNGKLQWDPTKYPSGLPTFIKALNDMGFKYGIYGASSGVTCQVDPGQLFHEQVDADTYAEWGVSYLKSDNCASYAMDSSVRFGAMRDALNRTGNGIVLSIEPFSINPDPAQSVEVSNLWRVARDIQGVFDTFMDRADVSDKWSPLAGPGGWNDPDMINVHGGLSLGENRLYFGLWAIMKAPLLLSTDVRVLPDSILAIVNSTGLIDVNQDVMGVQARKLGLGSKPLPWNVGLESCSPRPSSSFYSRTMNRKLGGDTRTWTVTPAGSATVESAQHPSSLPVASQAASNGVQIVNKATGRCLHGNATGGDEGVPLVSLVPCSATDSAQVWSFDMGLTTVSSITNKAAGLSLAASNGTLYAANHLSDAFMVSDAAYGLPSLTLAPRYVLPTCTDRNCQDYDPSQLWYFSTTDGMLRQSLFTASLNHNPGTYTLTQKVPTWRHHCLAHVLGNERADNAGTVSASTEVWGGPLSGGHYVMAFVNRGPSDASIVGRFSSLEMDGIDDSTKFDVTNLWTGQETGTFTGSFTANVSSHDMAVFRLSPVSL